MKGCDALEMLEMGHVLTSNLGGGVKIRWNAMRNHLEMLQEGQVPVPTCENQWFQVSMDIASLFKYDWTVTEDY